MGPTRTISLNMHRKCCFPYTALTIFKSPLKNNYSIDRAEPKENLKHTFHT